MSEWSLKFIPFEKSPFIVNLFEEDEQISDPDNIANYGKQNNYVFSDLSYEFMLLNDDRSSIRDVAIYINDECVSSTYEKNKICFRDSDGNNRRIFLDCFGFVKLDLILKKNDGTEQRLSSDYLSVLVKRGELNEHVKEMVHYVYTHQELLSLNGETFSRDLAGFHNSQYRNLETQLILTEQIATIYEKCFGYFKANSRSKIDNEPTVDYLEHLQYITPTTLEYITNHPEQLKQVNSSTGIRIGSRVYQPQKTRFLKNAVSYDTYENHVILEFLKYMTHIVNELEKSCNKLLKEIPNEENYSSEYIYSSFFMFSETKKTLEDGRETLDKLSKTFAQLYDSYSRIFEFDITDEPQQVIWPKPTAIFLSVPQYNQIFVNIQKWFNVGVYNFEEEKYMLSFLKVSTIYEKYLLEKMCEYIIDCDYKLYKSIRCEYPFEKKVKFKNASGDNTFFFSDGQKNITLYYQPVIYNRDSRSVNGMGLYRNNSLPVDNENYDGINGGTYYTPDFLIKIEDNVNCKYLILDAKFSNKDTVIKYEVKDLAFKYLFSISPVDTNDIILGMCLIYGKCNEAEGMTSVYDNQLLNNNIEPMAELLPLMEGIANDKQYVYLDRLFRKVL